MADRDLEGMNQGNETEKLGAHGVPGRTWTPTSIAHEGMNQGSASADPSAQPTAQQYAQPSVSAVDSVASFTEAAIEESRKKRAGKRRAGLVVLGVVAALLAIYLGGAAWFSGHFLPNTEIGKYDLSGIDAEQAKQIFDAASDEYSLKVEGAGLDFDVTSEDSGLRIDSAKVVQKAMDKNAFWTWPAAVVGSVQDLTDTLEVTYDKKGFRKFIAKKVNAWNEKARDPTSATIAYNKKQQAFVEVPEELGTKLDKKVVVDKVEEAALQMEAGVEIGEDELLRPDVLAGDKKLAAAIDEANAMLDTDLQLRIGGIDWLEVGSKQVAKWVKLGKDVKPTIDEDALRAWAGKKVAATNTVGTTRTFKTPRGDSVSVSGGSYGWIIDYEPFLKELTKAIEDKETGDFDVPCVQYAAAIPNDNGVDFGKRYIDVNLSAQHAVFYDGDEVLWESDIISGSPDGEHDTPYGVYMVNLKESPSTLTGEMTAVEVTSGKGKHKTTTVEYQPEYETEVQYWMPFVGNAIGFHDATWQPDFGGSMYMDGYGSHGCVNLPYDAAEALYGIVEAGVPVIVHG